MKKLFALLVIVLFASASYGQWAVNGTHIYNTNSGNVGIGTSVPAQLLHLKNATKSNILCQ